MPEKKEKKSQPKAPRNNHVIHCLKYENCGLFKGDTYTYRGIFRRHGGEFSKQFRGYVVPLDNIFGIEEELKRQISGYIIKKLYEKLPVVVPGEYIDDGSVEEVEKNEPIVSDEEEEYDTLLYGNTAQVSFSNSNNNLII